MGGPLCGAKERSSFHHRLAAMKIRRAPQQPPLGARLGKERRWFCNWDTQECHHARSTDKQVFIAWLSGTAGLSVMVNARAARDKTRGQVQEGLVPYFDTSIPSEAHRKRAPQCESELEHPKFGAVIRAWA